MQQRSTSWCSPRQLQQSQVAGFSSHMQGSRCDVAREKTCLTQANTQGMFVCHNATHTVDMLKPRPLCERAGGAVFAAPSQLQLRLMAWQWRCHGSPGTPVGAECSGLVLGEKSGNIQCNAQIG
uniref:Uncharacterized protein n=1 Tax=Eutreptiella gymnastica TaxID=73025 RepID=A0A7S4L9P5_9EUGL